MAKQGRRRMRATAAREKIHAAAADGGTAEEHAARLCRLLGLAVAEAGECCYRTRLARLDRLERALAAERRRGRARDPGYDLDRHIALARTAAVERAALALPPARAISLRDGGRRPTVEELHARRRAARRRPCQEWRRLFGDG